MDFAALRQLIERWRARAEGLREGSESPELTSAEAWGQASTLDQCADDVEELIPVGN